MSVLLLALTFLLAVAASALWKVHTLALNALLPLLVLSLLPPVPRRLKLVCSRMKLPSARCCPRHSTLFYSSSICSICSLAPPPPPHVSMAVWLCLFCCDCLSSVLVLCDQIKNPILFPVFLVIIPLSFHGALYRVVVLEIRNLKGVKGCDYKITWPFIYFVSGWHWKPPDKLKARLCSFQLTVPIIRCVCQGVDTSASENWQLRALKNDIGKYSKVSK